MTRRSTVDAAVNIGKVAGLLAAAVLVCAIGLYSLAESGRDARDLRCAHPGNCFNGVFMGPSPWVSPWPGMSPSPVRDMRP